MTDYDYFPPIRFRFSGDVDQAKGRIPQARTLMAQLIRRMEGFGRDTGQWQGQMSDGTQFRVAKMGDVHVADIFGVTPSVKPPVNARGVAYDLRVITPGAPMAAGPETVIPETVIPEIPAAPHTPPRDILMRPHGERFGGDGNYLWVGARLIGPAYSEDVYPTSYATSGTITTITTWRSTPGPTGTWNKYLGINIAGKTDYSKAGYYSVPVDSEGDATEIPAYVKSPSVNLVLFAPDAKDRVPGSIFQTWDVGSSSYQASNQYGAGFSRQVYTGNENIPWWNTADALYDPAGWVVGYDYEPLIQNCYFSNTVYSSRGVYTSDYICRKDGPIAAHAYLCIDAKDPEKIRSDFYVPTSLDTNIASGLSAQYNGFSVLTEPEYSTSGTPSSEATGTGTHSVTFVGTAAVVHETAAPVEYDDPVSVPASSDDIKDGVYELRLSASGFPDLSIDGWSDVTCEVYIQLGDTLKTYTVNLNASIDYGDTQNYILFGSQPSRPMGGWFDEQGWINDGTPTPFADTWYPGCWLIDIKNQTVIHETNPANLTRDWFTTE